MRGRTKGLTLVEVLVALAFTGLAFTALALSQVTGFKVTRSSQESAIAKDMAMRQLELFRGYGFEPFKRCPTFDPDVSGGFVGYPPCEGSESSTEYPGFEMSWSLTNRPQGTKSMSMPALIEVSIEVAWRGLEPGKEYTLTSYLSCGDPGEYATTNIQCPKESLGPW